MALRAPPLLRGRRFSLRRMPGSPQPAIRGLPPVAAARRLLDHRRIGYTGFAVLDSEGRISGEHLHRTFVSASVVKAMLLVAYLSKLAAARRGLDAASRARSSSR